MEISSASSAPSSRSVTPSRSSSDRQTYDHAQAEIVENKTQERADQQRAVQEKIQQQNQENQRRLDGRLITFGNEEGSVASDKKQANYNRSRVNEAYSPPQYETSHSQENQAAQSPEREAEPIDIVV